MVQVIEMETISIYWLKSKYHQTFISFTMKYKTYDCINFSIFEKNNKLIVKLNTKWIYTMWQIINEKL